MPLYDMVVKLLVGVVAWYVFVFLSLCMLIIPTEILNRLTISPVMACLLIREMWLLLVLASGQPSSHQGPHFNRFYLKQLCGYT